MVQTRIVSSLEKALSHEDIKKYPRLKKISALMGERVAVQYLYTRSPDTGHVEGVQICTPSLSGELAKYTTVRRVEHIGAIKTTDAVWDDNYISTRPGLYPDLLQPLGYGGRARIVGGALESLWLEITLPEDCSELPDDPTLKVTLLFSDGSPLSEDEVTVHIVRSVLPEQTLIHTEWFYADSIAFFYRVPMWSKKHWELLEVYARSAVRCGVNMLLTPLTTYATNGRRANSQLVKIKKVGDGYRFGFSRLDRWIEMCNRVGIKYFELTHICNGAVNPARVWVMVDGEEKLLFDYGMSATDPEYTKLIRALLKAFLAHMKHRGDDGRCFFHVSDEPGKDRIEKYAAVKESVADILKGYPVMDALYNLEFYERGLVNNPVPALGKEEPFIEAKVENLWTYYANGPMDGNYTNRHVMMPSCRNRSLGLMLYKYNLKGFLHWGFNHWLDQRSEHLINPYVEISSDRWLPAGDPFLVYPGFDGKPLESIRYSVLHEAMQDIRALRLAESLYSREEVIRAIDEAFGEPITFRTSARHPSQILSVRERINRMIEERI